MKTMKKLVACVLTLCIAAGMLAVGASAEEPYVMVNLGDSMSQGYFLEDYNMNHGGTGNNLSKMSYPYLMEGWLREKLNREVKSYHLTFEGTRPNEIYGILNHDNNPVIDKYTLEYLKQYEEYYKGCQSDYPELAEYDLYTGVTECIKKADLITYDMGMNNFGMYLVRRLENVLGGNGEVSLDYKDHFSKIIAEYEPLYGAAVEVLRVALAQILAVYDIAAAEAIIDAFLYSYGSFILYFDKSMDILHKLNPDAMVIVVGTFNCFPGMTANFNGTDLNVDALVGLLFGSMNAYMTEKSEYNYWFKYADCFTGGVQTFLGELQTEEGATTRSIQYAVIEDAYSLQREGKARVTDIVKAHIAAEFAEEYARKVNEANASLETDAAKANAEKALIRDAYKVAGTESDNGYYAAVREAFAPVMEAYHAAARRGKADLSGIFTDGDFDYNGVLAAGGASEDERSMAALISHYIMAYANVGMHPSPKGAAQKFGYVTKAYESKFAANGAKYEVASDIIGSIFPNLADIFSIITSAILSIQNFFMLRFGGIFKLLDLKLKLLP